jgi:hypothetical protein
LSPFFGNHAYCMADLWGIMPSVLKISRQFVALAAVALVLATGVPKICCGMANMGGQSAVCKTGQCCGCPDCAKNGCCRTMPCNHPQSNDSTRHAPTSNFCTQSPQLAFSKSADHSISFTSLFVNFDIAAPYSGAPEQLENCRPSLNLPNFPGHPTLLSLSCALTL